MTNETVADWIELSPRLTSQTSRKAFTAHARDLSRADADERRGDAVEQLRDTFVAAAAASGRSDRQALLAAGLVLTDLVTQGWTVRVRGRRTEAHPPAEVSDDREAEKARVRGQELVKRDAQLRQAPVQKFLRSMEATRVFEGKFTSIFRLMRDGRELAEGLRRARAHSTNGWAGVLAGLIDPYLQFVSSDDTTCPWTGLRLMDVWRYFRHTWSNQYTSVPGRTMLFLVRDRAAPFHPVIGIGALSSPVMQIRERDTWIGWHSDSFLTNVRDAATDQAARWLLRVVNEALDEIYLDDLVEDEVIKLTDVEHPSAEVIARLLTEAGTQRRLHHRYVRSRDHKNVSPPAGSDPEYWVARARTHLFRSKRALALATYLQARATLQQAFGSRPTAAKLAALASTSEGTDAIRKVLKKAKADRVGISVADITVCGAVQPYNPILGGKLVAMLATSPEVVLEYRRRYAQAQSEIASSVAGRPIVRTPALVLLGTTSLYGVGSSQYNRIKIPCDRIGGVRGETIRYHELGYSEAFGTSQYSEETVDALADLAQQSTNGQRVNSIFGEGISPKLRKVRQGLDLLGLSAEKLLRHHRRRIVYAVPLIRNVREHLLGMDRQPDYVVPLEEGAAATARIAGWWRERWLHRRIASDDVLVEVERHTLVRPVRHGARVVIPPPTKQRLLFADLA